MEAALYGQAQIEAERGAVGTDLQLSLAAAEEVLALGFDLAGDDAHGTPAPYRVTTHGSAAGLYEA
jgi:hypothetical protein